MIILSPSDFRKFTKKAAKELYGIMRMVKDMGRELGTPRRAGTFAEREWNYLQVVLEPTLGAAPDGRRSETSGVWSVAGAVTREVGEHGDRAAITRLL